MNRIFWIGLMRNNSVGDHANTVAIGKLLNTYFSNHEVKRFFRSDIYSRWNKIRKTIKDNDLIFIHSSGDFGSLFGWHNGNEMNGWHRMRRKIISDCRNNFIVQLPTTVNYEDSDDGRKTLAIDKEFYKDKDNFLLMCREYGSLEQAKQLGCAAILVPDFVISLIPQLKNYEREGCLIVIRSDHEATFNNEQKEMVEFTAKKYFQHVITKNIQNATHNLTDADREEYIYMVLDEYQKYKLVITDRMHGMIFSVITRTPCIAFNDRIPHKISGYKRILGCKTMQFIESINDLESKMEEMKDVFK